MVVLGSIIFNLGLFIFLALGTFVSGAIDLELIGAVVMLIGLVMMFWGRKEGN